MVHLGALKAVAESVERLEGLLAKLPDGLAKDLRLRIATLRSILLEQRPPALVLVGRRGAGKSSLINAMFGAKVAEVGHVKAQTAQGTWFDYVGDFGSLSILDTRGVQEGSRPADATDATPIDSILFELRKKPPDVILFLVKASEVDAAIDADIEALRAILDEVERAHGHRVPVLGVATHCDLLEPKTTRLHAPEHEVVEDLDEKLRHVALVERHLDTKLRDALRSDLATTLGLSSYLSWRQDGSLRSDERWRIDTLAKALYRHLPNEGRATLVRVARVRHLQDELADQLTKASAAVCAGFAALPIPVADVVPITAVQAGLIAGIAWIGGRALDARAAAEFLAGIGVNVGVALLLREAARALIKYAFPGAGSAVSGAVAFTGTLAVGAAARAYFLRGESMRVARRLYARTKKEPGVLEGASEDELPHHNAEDDVR